VLQRVAAYVERSFMTLRIRLPLVEEIATGNLKGGGGGGSLRLPRFGACEYIGGTRGFVGLINRWYSLISDTHSRL